LAAINHGANHIDVYILDGVCFRKIQESYGLLRIVDDRCMIVDYRGNMPKPSDLLQGTLDFLILKTIASEPLHGWGIARRIQVVSGDVLSVGQGSLYPALHRLEQQGWITSEWKESDLGRSAKFYSLTREGKKQLERELQSRRRLSGAVELLIEST
jgi:PadR family transcriptional regulator PadR